MAQAHTTAKPFMALFYILALCGIALGGLNTGARTTPKETAVRQTVSCRLCGQRGQTKINPGAKSYSNVSFDTDGMIYSWQPGDWDADLQECPNCHLCAASLTTRINGDRNKIRNEIEAVIKSFASEEKSLPDYVKLSIKARVSELIGQPALAIAENYQRAAWALRSHITSEEAIVLSHTGPEEILKRITALEDNRNRSVGQIDQSETGLRLALLCHRLGFGAERDAWLTAVNNLPGGSAASIDTAKKITRMIVSEKALATKAIEHYRQALKNTPVPGVRERYSILYIADNLRRFGQTNEAKVLYEGLKASLGRQKTKASSQKTSTDIRTRQETAIRYLSDFGMDNLDR